MTFMPSLFISRRHPLSSFRLTAVIANALVLVACTTEKISPPPSPTLPKTEKQDEKINSEPTTTTSTPSTTSTPFVTQFEAALARRDCSLIQSLEKQLIAPPESYANSVVLATSWCAHQKSPESKEAHDKFLAVAEQTLKTEAPLFSAGFIEQLKGESYFIAGDLNASRAAFSKAIGVSALHFMSLVSGQALKTDLQGIESMLTGSQSALLKEVRSSLSDPATQASALTKLDELLSQLSPGTVYDKLLAVRLKLFSAFELSFASQLSTLEETRMKGDAVSLESAAGKIRRLFPSRPHQARIDSITGSQNANKTVLAENPNAQNPQCASLTPAAMLSPAERADLSPDKALQMAKMALNDGKPGDAVEILDGLSETNKNEKTRGLRREASEAHIKDMRRKASEIYKRVSLTSDAQSKLDSLSQCKQILENILNRYPETDSYTRRNIQKFLNSVSENISELRKGQVK